MNLLDFDNDGDLDVAISGEILPNFNYSLKIYRNDNTVFTNIPGFYNSFAGPLAWGDFDNNGYPDLLAVGSGKIINNTNGAFYYLLLYNFSAILLECLPWGL